MDEKWGQAIMRDAVKNTFCARWQVLAQRVRLTRFDTPEAHPPKETFAGLDFLVRCI